MNDKSIDANRISALQDALEWAQDRLRFYASYSEKPDSPFWNDWRYAEAVLEGHDPDRNSEPHVIDAINSALRRLAP